MLVACIFITEFIGWLNRNGLTQCRLKYSCWPYLCNIGLFPHFHDIFGAKSGSSSNNGKMKWKFAVFCHLWYMFDEFGGRERVNDCLHIFIHNIGEFARIHHIPNSMLNHLHWKVFCLAWILNFGHRNFLNVFWSLLYSQLLACINLFRMMWVFFFTFWTFD